MENKAHQTTLDQDAIKQLAKALEQRLIDTLNDVIEHEDREHVKRVRRFLDEKEYPIPTPSPAMGWDDLPPELKKLRIESGEGGE